MNTEIVPIEDNIEKATNPFTSQTMDDGRRPDNSVVMNHQLHLYGPENTETMVNRSIVTRDN